MVRALLIGGAIVALGATAGGAQRARHGPADPYAPANDTTLDLKPTGSHSRSRPLDELVALGALTPAEARARRARESQDQPAGRARP